MDPRSFGFDPVIMDTLHDLLDFPEESEKPHAPSRAYVRDTKAMRATPADVKELPNAYVFVLDMPGLKADHVKVNIEDDNQLIVSGERKREKEEGVKFLKMERRLGKYLKKFELPENANLDTISAVYDSGVLTVTVEKKAPPEPKQPKVVEVKIA